MTTQTPWGHAQRIEPAIMPGINFVSTASHGGYRVKKEAALKLLSSAAISRAIDAHGHYWFEEDCDAAMIDLEIWQYVPSLQSRPLSSYVTELSYFRRDYLIERGITPDPTAQNLMAMLGGVKC